MAYLVTVNKSVIKNGKSKQNDLKMIWKDKYYDGLQDWLLSLTEAFDLTVRVRNQKMNIVPCFLPA
jgi:hypothetical protein